MIPDWLQPTIVLFPFAAWIFWGVGIPWALALLPRDLWRERITVITLGMALGPLGVTVILFALGTAGRITLAGTLVGSAVLAGVGIAVSFQRSAFSKNKSGLTLDESGRIENSEARGVNFGERLILVGIALLIGLNVIVTAYWPFLAYDVLWVFGYNARVFVLEGHIPSEIGYYPQLIPLSYTTMQQAWEALGHAAINDHAARVVIPWFNVTAILMAYQLGRRVFQSRRVALLSAAVWAFYPHVAAWSGAGDLEIALTLYVTGAAAFFVEAWRTERARFAVISGVLLAGALWTKPTGGALALGVMLAVGGFMLLHARQPKIWWPKLRIALITGLVCAPVGSMWYVRNLALGHEAVTFPATYWHSFAQRSGQELGWPLLIAALVAGGIAISRQPSAFSKSKGEEGTTAGDSPLSLRSGERGQGIGVKKQGAASSAPTHNRMVRFLPLLALILMIAGALPT
ncbi:MAG: glycosyltransferase family 39 protein, partial [Chloroflexi bacterium]|nr:glycosyltransferase family 39 protein [Chloroflexota bacterium]